MKLIIRNLSRQTKESEILALLSSIGKVTEFTLVMDQATGNSKGFGFAEMPYNDEANAAIKTLDGRDIDGSKIRVKKAAKGTKQKFSSDK